MSFLMYGYNEILYELDRKISHDLASVRDVIYGFEYNP